MVEIEHLEGSLRRKQIDDMSYEYWCELTPHGLLVKIPLPKGVSLREARDRATQIELSNLGPSISFKSYEISERSPVQQQLLSSLTDCTVGNFLIEALEIDTVSLNDEQDANLKFTILSLSGAGQLGITSAQARASAKMFKTARDKLARVIEFVDENLDAHLLEDYPVDPEPGGVWKNLLSLQQSLVMAERSARNVVDGGQRNPASDYLSWEAIRAYLRWKPDWRNAQQLGVSYPEDWREKFSTTVRAC